LDLSPDLAHLQENDFMQIGVYGCGYLGTVVAACLADFGVPVTAYGSDAVNTTLLATGTLPFHEKNLSDIVRRGVRAGRLMYSTHLQSMVQRAEIIYLAEDSNKRIEQWPLKLPVTATMARFWCWSRPCRWHRPPHRRRPALPRQTDRGGFPSDLFVGRLRRRDFNWPDRIVLGTASSQAVSA